MVALTSVLTSVIAMASAMYQVSAIHLDYQVDFERYSTNAPPAHPYSKLACDTKPIGRDTIGSPHCKSWRKGLSFDHFSYMWKPHDPFGEGDYEKATASKYGNCTIKVFEMHDCTGALVAEVLNANDPKSEGKCEMVAGRGGHSVFIGCFGGYIH